MKKNLYLLFLAIFVLGFTINSSATCPPITGTAHVCVGSTTALADTFGTLIGTWTSSATAVATVAAGGVVTGVRAGTTIITYEETCGTATVVVTVNAAPGAIIGTPTLCTGATLTLTDASTGGSWSSSATSVATVGTTAVPPGATVHGVTAGTTIISYTTDGGCSATVVVTVNGPAVISPATATVCVSGTVALTDATTGGTWSGTSTVVSVGATGIVTGEAGGTAIITYTAGSGGTGSCTSVHATVNVITSFSSIGPGTPEKICIGNFFDFTEATSGGTWSTSSTSIATVTSTGQVYGVSAGAFILSYYVAGCSVALSHDTIITALPAVSPRNPSICEGDTVTLMDATTGGSWISETTTVATVVSTGIVTGAVVTTASTAVIQYTVGGCTAYDTVTVTAGAGAITPATTVSICAGGSASLADGTSGGTWSSGNTTVATIGAGGVVIGVGDGTAVISYSIGRCVATKIVTVRGPVAVSPHNPSICVGGTVSLTDANTGGSWFSSSTATATVGTTGTVTGASVGTTVISYILTSCIAPDTVTVTNGAGTISSTGSASICVGSTVILTESSSAGSWSSANTTIATVTSGGFVTGARDGTTTILYTIGTCSSTETVTVRGPVAISPHNPDICLGGTVALTDAVSGGTWSSDNSSIASVTSGGVVTGGAVSTTVINYTTGGGTSSSCSVADTITVTAGAGTISPSGIVSVCLGSSTTLTDGTSGGVWSSSNTGVATVGISGTVIGQTAGTAVISYTVGSCSATSIVSVIAASAITPATASICVGGTVALTESAGGATWSSSNTAIAAVGLTSGVVSGVTAGVVTIITHIGTAPGGCTFSATVTVNPVPGAITPSGSVTVCAGSSTTLADGTTGGSWSSLSTGTATVSSSGAVYGVVAGTATISYTVGTCGVAKIVNVIAGPGALSSSSVTLCTGTTTTLTDATSGGTWSSTATGIATVAAGVVGGVAPGTATINYSVGTCVTTATVTVIASPAAISPTGATSICVNNTVTLGETATGGVWSSGNTALATVSGGLVSTLTAGAVTISYTVGSCSATKIVTILPGPAAILPASPIVCTGTTLSLTEATTGGAWASSSTANATVSPTGVVYGVAAGTATILYAAGSCSASTVLTVDISPAGITPGVAVTICQGTTTTLADATSGGIWSSAATGTATVSSGGIVGGITSGSVTISYTEGVCSATKVVVVAPAPAALSPASSTTCVGYPLTLTDAVTGGTWSSSSGAIATVNSAGLVTAVSAGTVNIYYLIGSCLATASVTVTPSPSVGTVAGSTYVCVGSTTPLTDLATGGSWSSSNTATATVSGTGVVYGVSNGTTTISYYNTSSCGVIAATLVVSANTTPTAGTISGITNICAGTTSSLSDAVLGGTWFASNGNATVTLTGGLVTGVTSGLDTITYKITTPCGIASTSVVVTIGSFISAGTISGSTSLCGGTTIALTITGATGGVWGSSNSSASVSSTGVVTGAAAGGIDTISYIVAATCGADTSTQIITVNPDPEAGSISSGVSTICVGTTTTLTETVTGGAWSASNGNATVTGGIVTGAAPGTVTISYTYTNSCGSAVATDDLTITGTATAGTITGPSTVCSGAPITLTDGVSGGVWSSSNTANATISSGGLVTAVSSGTVTISYSVGSSCGTTVATYPVAVSGTAFGAGTILGISSICVGTYTVFADSTRGGTWSSSNSNVTVTTSGLPTAVITGEAVGISTISYTVANSCGTTVATQVVTISGEITAGVISGQGNVCIGFPVTLTESVSDGVWSTSNTNATVSSAGVVTGTTAGMDTVLYTVTSTCGTVTATFNISVDASGPTAGTISGPTSICAGYPIMFTNDIAGGTWSFSNTHATISSAGLVNGVTTGSDILTYTVTTPCGTAHTTQTITIGSSLGVAVITGSSVLCDGSTISLADLTTGGTWSSSDANATVSTVGAVSGVTAGTATITYSVTYACGIAYATKTETVNLSSGIPSISGPDTVCQGTTITLSDVATGGVWSVGNTDATITTGGIVTGVTAGIAPVSYTINSTSCGYMSAVSNVDVVASTASGIGPISSLSIACVGSGITLVDATPGGTWESSNGHAIVVGAGIIDGVSPGIDTISYVVTGTCGVGAATKVLTVDAIPIVSAIIGSGTLCLGSTIALSDPTAGGLWTTSTPAVGTVGDFTGVVTGVSLGVTTITYTYTDLLGCPGSVTLTDTVISATLTTGITGSATVCVGATVTLSDATMGGTWTSSNPSVGAIGLTSGIISGIAPGTTTLTYTAEGTCGVASVTSVETVETSPVVSAISGTLTVCAGATTALSDATADGVWSSGTTAVAIVNAISGAVTGVSGGTDEITYSVANSCGSRSVSASITVYSGPAVDAITAAFTALCTGGTLDVSDATGGGVWVSTNTSIATVSSTGAVLGNAAGIDTVFYIVTNSHGCSSSAMVSITVGGEISSASVEPVGSVELCPGNTENMNVTSSGGITYQWLRDGSVIAGATASAYSTSAAGSYAAEVSNGFCNETIAGPTVTTPILPVISFTAPDLLHTSTYATYQWFLNGAAISGATSNTINETAAGLYTVVVTDAGGCSDTSIAYSSPGASGINGIGIAQNIKVYPNPATSVIHIDAPVQVNVSVMSIDGKVLIQQNNTADIDVSGLADGIYMIQVYNQGGLLLKTTKFAKME